MAKSQRVLVSSLYTSIRALSDTTNNTDAVADATLLTLINDAVRELHAECVEANPDWNLASVTFTLPAGSSTYSTTAFLYGTTTDPVYAMRGLDQLDGNDWVPIPSHSLHRRGLANTDGVTYPYAVGTSWRYSGDMPANSMASGIGHKGTLTIIPAPASATRFRAWFVPYPPAYTASNEYVHGGHLWHRFIVAYAVCDLRAVEESENNYWFQERERLRRRIVSAVQTSNLDGPETVRDENDYGLVWR